jgi:hypothetical protein
MVRRTCVAAWAVALGALPGVAYAGMPAGVTLTEAARARLHTISFFLVVLLLTALAVMGIWNYLRRDFVRLPRLTYGKACGLVALWGLLFVVVLLMISGARELLTPGAWERDGVTYKLRETGRPPDGEAP